MTDSTREELRSSIDELGRTNVFPGPAGSWEYVQDIARSAMEIANRARDLPNPQPMFVPVPGDGSPGPSKLHALRLYIEALMIAKGTVWFDWLATQSETLMRTDGQSWLFCGSTPPYRHGEYGDKFGATACILLDGTVECGPECPPLPLVTL